MNQVHLLHNSLHLNRDCCCCFIEFWLQILWLEVYVSLILLSIVVQLAISSMGCDQLLSLSMDNKCVHVRCSKNKSDCACLFVVRDVQCLCRGTASEYLPNLNLCYGACQYFIAQIEKVLCPSMHGFLHTVHWIALCVGL